MHSVALSSSCQFERQLSNQLGREGSSAGVTGAGDRAVALAVGRQEQTDQPGAHQLISVAEHCKLQRHFSKAFCKMMGM